MYILVLITRKYGTVKIDYFDASKFENEEYVTVLKKLTNSYKKCTEINTNNAQKASSKYKIGTILALIAIILTVVCYAMAYFFV